jgi:hypothetical protein
MPIDFNRQMIFDPKIDIIGNEVPLAEMEKTGDALQERYDKSTDAYNKFKTVSKQTEQIADESERQKVRDYNAALAGQIKSIGEKGDMHNMLAETTSLANEAAANYLEFKTRADKIAEYKTKIADSTAVKDAVNKEYYQSKLDDIIKQTTFNPESKTFNFKSIVAPNMAATFDFTGEMFKLANGWQPTTTGFKNDNVEVVNAPTYDKNGNMVRPAGVYDRHSGRAVSSVEAKEITDALVNSVAGMPGAEASLNADTDAYMWKNKIPADQRDAVYKKIYEQKVLKPIGAAASKESFTNVSTESGVKLADANTQLTYGFGPKPSDNNNFTEEMESTGNLGEASPLIASLTDISNTIDKSKETFFKDPHDKNRYDIKLKPEYQNQAKLVFSGLSVHNLTKMKNGTFEQQALYKKLDSANVYGVYNAIMDGKPVNRNKYKKIIDILSESNYQPSQAYKWLTTNDSRVQKELGARFPTLYDAQGNFDAVKGTQALNQIALGDPKGLTLDKDGNFVSGNAEGYSILDPQTGQMLSMAEATKKGFDGEPLLKANQTLQVTGKVMPGSLAFGNSMNPQSENMSYFGSGYTVNSNGKQYIIAKRSEVNSPAAKLNDLGSFSRFVRDDKQYSSTHGPISVKSNGSQVYVKGKNAAGKVVTKKYEADEFTNLLYTVGNADLKNGTKIDPIDYLSLNLN